MYDGGVKIHPMTFRGVLGQNRAIGEYQVRQTASGADVAVIAHGDLGRFHAIRLGGTVRFALSSSSR